MHIALVLGPMLSDQYIHAYEWVREWLWLRKREGFNVASLDIDYGERAGHPRSHNFLRSPGFLSQPKPGFLQVFAGLAKNFVLGSEHALLRAAIYAAMMVAPGCLLHMAPDCRSWGVPARGTSLRSVFNVCGVGREFVAEGNMMAARFPGCAILNTYMHGYRLLIACCHDKSCVKKLEPWEII